LLEKDDVTSRITAIRLIEERRITTAFAQLKKGLEDSDANVRKAALDAFGQVASIDELPMLLGFLGQVKNLEDLEALQRVLKSACTRMPKDNAAAETVKIFSASPRPIQLFLLELLAEIGGRKALETVESYAWGNDVPLKDKASEVLGQWRWQDDVDLVANACLKLAKEASDDRYKIRGLRAYIRLARQFNMPEEKRLAMTKQMFELATRDADKILVFEVYSRYPSANMLTAALSHIDAPAFREKACEAAVLIGERTTDKSEPVAAAMKVVLEKGTDTDMKARAQRVLDRQ
jgi:HEAT repeat protein